MLEGDVEAGKSILRDYANATVGFSGLAEGLDSDRDPKSFMRMLSVKGNPSMQNVFAILNYCQQNEGISLQLQVKPHPKRRVTRLRQIA